MNLLSRHFAPISMGTKIPIKQRNVIGIHCPLKFSRELILKYINRHVGIYIVQNKTSMAKNIVLDTFRITGKRKIFIFTGFNNAMKKYIPQPQYSRIKYQTLQIYPS